MDQQFGNMDGRHLMLRWLAPFSFESWDGNTFRFRWRNLLNPRRWLSAARGCGAWRMGVRRFRDRTGRCYCPTGNSIDAELVLCGFGALVWYSHFTGKTPCTCDCAMAEHFGCSDCGALPVVKDSTLCAACSAEVEYAEHLEQLVEGDLGHKVDSTKVLDDVGQLDQRAKS